MLASNVQGFAVMNSELTAFSFEHHDLSVCKTYCRRGSVIVEMIPVICGFNLRICFYKIWRLAYFGKFGMKNILWFHWSIGKEYKHKKGKIVYTMEVKP
jgi:hypothetical protein